jgi:hypothetical protein
MNNLKTIGEGVRRFGRVIKDLKRPTPTRVPQKAPMRVPQKPLRSIPKRISPKPIKKMTPPFGAMSQKEKMSKSLSENYKQNKFSNGIGVGP